MCPHGGLYAKTFKSIDFSNDFVTCVHISPHRSTWCFAHFVFAVVVVAVVAVVAVAVAAYTGRSTDKLR
jgi:hypothetical protein